jgi:Holliday junction resolvase RusA-like endonuclease
MKFKIYLDPVPKGRPRFNSRTMTTFTPPSTKNFQKALRNQIFLLMRVEKESLPVYGKGIPLSLDIDFVYRRPKRLCRKMDPEGYIYMPTSSDLDNLEKSVMDALNNVLWHDDRQIVELNSRKFHSPKGGEGHIAIWLRPAGDPPQYLADSNLHSITYEENKKNAEE